MDTLTVIAECSTHSDNADRLRTALEGMIEPSLAESGCLAYQPYVDPNQPERMVIIEEWVDTDALQRHFATAHFAHVKGVLDEVLTQPLTIRTFVASPTVSSRGPSTPEVIDGIVAHFAS